jgi:hypothetical protein
MKLILFTFIFLIPLSSFAIWDPPDKVIMTILRKAERTPEMLLNKQYSKMEEFKVDRINDVASPECGGVLMRRHIGITKFTTRFLDSVICREKII